MSILREVAVNGIVLGVEDEGQGPALVLLHSGVTDSRMWDPQFGWLASSHRVVRWDHRGYRDTPHVPGPFSYAADVLAVLDALGIGKATLIGASMGGMMAIRVALEHPERIERLVLVGTNLYGYEPSPVVDVPPYLAAAYEKADKAEDFEAMMELDLQFWIAGIHRRPSDLDVAFITLSRDMLRSTYQPQNGSEPTDDETSDVDRIGELTMPVLVVVGEEDAPTIQRIGRLIAEKAPRAQFTSLANAAHSPSLEQAERFNEILAQWLEGTSN